MPMIRVLAEEVHELAGTVNDGRVWVSSAALPDIVGWSWRPEGLCRGDVCMPITPMRREAVVDGAQVDLGAVADLVGRVHVLDSSDDDLAVVALALNPEHRRQALDDLRAPSFTLPDLAGTTHALSEWHGQKKLLVTFASWCGCRYDLPGWQALHDELAPDGFSVVGVAIDNAPSDVEPWTEGINFPVLYDSAHLLSELYAISNVPTVVWIDEEDAIVRPNGVAFGSDLFSEFTGVQSTPHLDAVRAWVHDGIVPIEPDEARGAVADLNEDELRARLHFRIGADALARGDGPAARRNLQMASDLAPFDWSVRRAAMPLLGQDPFGPDFLRLYDEWKADGMPYHGLTATSGLGGASHD
ncbi:MAG TPA: TlpA disulfide reductase family protein [Acidimicrobiales bacterium]|jgi:peroxiredoxin|nr:TlpA disulfide reductase family protein [Acidimicrobiales bacterium]